MVSIVSESVKLNELELDGNAHSAGSATDGNHWRAEQQQKKDKLRSTAIIDIGFGGATNNEMETEGIWTEREIK